MTHQVLARKWRPRRFETVVGQSYVVQALKNALDQQFLHHAYLFTGTRGVGKTSLARILAKCLNCKTGITSEPCDQCEHCEEIDKGRFPDLFEIDAASRTKVEDTRDLLDNVMYAPSKGRFKIYLIDEVHMLSNHSFNALLKTLEEPPLHVKFLLATTDYQKLPATILSRCLQFHLTPMLPSQIADHLKHLLTEEGITYETDALIELGKAANGSMRDALSLLDQSIAYGNGRILTADIKTMLGIIEPTILIELLEALSTNEANHLCERLNKLSEQGIDYSQALADLLSLLHQIAVLQAVPQVSQESVGYSERLRALAKVIPRETVQLFYQIGIMGQRDLAHAPTSRSGFEMTLLRMLAFYPDTNPSSTQLPITTITATPAPAKKNIPTTPVSKAPNTWHELLPKLELSGAALALAQQCSLKSMTDDRIELLLHPKQKPLLQKKHIDRFSQTLSNILNRPMTVGIEINEDVIDTPANHAKKEQHARAQAAEKKVIGNEQVQRIMQTFDATLVKTSIIRDKEGA